jgi:site-specific DNA-methyltransferase (adenine-specific)
MNAPVFGKKRAPRNRTITLTQSEREDLATTLMAPAAVAPDLMNATILGDCLAVAPKLGRHSIDLLFLDPPYNLNKRFGEAQFSRRSVEEYADWLGSLIDAFMPTLRPTATVYVCGDWHTSASIFTAIAPRLNVRNRITWEREKGRGALSNWKNSSEDVWFCTVGNEFTFNVEAVKLRRKVIAPYRDSAGRPKDWDEGPEGNFRDTHPSNLWTDITVPFWSMPENTDHPTQKSEKFLAKLLLASTNPGDVVLDPFLGSGTTSVVAQKLGRRFLGIEIVEEYALLAAHRLCLARRDPAIQGYVDGVFWERNSSIGQGGCKERAAPEQTLPF